MRAAQQQAIQTKASSVLEAPWSCLWAILRLPWAVLDASWTVLETSWNHHELSRPSWRQSRAS
eukprot:8600088-Pyramimonas_sp.AAC.1